MLKAMYLWSDAADAELKVKAEDVKVDGPRQLATYINEAAEEGERWSLG